MSVLISCNKCSGISSDEMKKKFLILECLHVLCTQCFKELIKLSRPTTDKKITCNICAKVVSFSMVGKGMDEEKRILFTDVAVEFKNMQKKVTQIATFQDNQRQILEKRILKRIQSNIKSLKELRGNSKKSEINTVARKNELEKAKARLRERRKTYHTLIEKCKKLQRSRSTVDRNSTSLKSLDKIFQYPPVNMAKSCCFGMLLIFFSLILPPLAVLLDDGCKSQFVISLLLTCLVYIPGVIHAFWVCFIREKPLDHRNCKPVYV